MFTNVNQAFFDVGGGFKLHFIDMTKAMSGATLKELKVRRPDIVEKLKPWNTSERKIAVIGNHVFLVSRKHFRSKVNLELISAAVSEMMSEWVGTRGVVFKVFTDDDALLDICRNLCNTYNNINISLCNKLVTTQF